VIVEKGESTIFYLYFGVLKRNNINIDSKNMLITKCIEKDAASNAKTSKTYFLGFLLVFAIFLVFFKNILKNKVKNWIAIILML
jgi:hypothetical protein